jgi:hypothetical protein
MTKKQPPKNNESTEQITSFFLGSLELEATVDWGNKIRFLLP